MRMLLIPLKRCLSNLDQLLICDIFYLWLVLVLLFQGYLEVWRETPNCPLSDKQLTDLFNNIEDIYKFNRWITLVLCQVAKLTEGKYKLKVR